MAGGAVYDAASLDAYRRDGQRLLVVDGGVYDAGAFATAHPGGHEVLREWVDAGGRDAGPVMRGEGGAHAHSAAAFRWLERLRVGTLAGAVGAGPGAARAAAAGADRAVDAMIDLNAPLVTQVGKLGTAYPAWVHAPETGSLRFFASPVLEALSRTPWWVVPLLWLPVAALALLAVALPPWATAACLAAGVAAWALFEYCMHRFLFHAEVTSPLGVTLQFLFHGCHHKFPTDHLRLVFPPAAAAPLVLLMHRLLHAALPADAGGAVFAGMLGGYVAYDCLHYATHHMPVAKVAPLARVKRAHLAHHYQHPDSGFGVTSPVLDWVFGTIPAKAAAKAR